MKNENWKNLRLIIVIASFMCVGAALCFDLAFRDTMSVYEEMIQKYTTLYKQIQSIDDKVSELESLYNDNVRYIYNRICEIQKSDPDEVRGAVIDKLMTDDKEPIEAEASILAFLENYDEFQSDIEIQTYLNDNARILKSIEKYESMKEKYDEFLTEYNDMYLKDEE